MYMDSFGFDAADRSGDRSVGSGKDPFKDPDMYFMCDGEYNPTGEPSGTGIVQPEYLDVLLLTSPYVLLLNTMWWQRAGSRRTVPRRFRLPRDFGNCLATEGTS